MENNINLIAFGTFGNPNGFQQTFFYGNNNLSKALKTFDIRETISINPESTVYSIRKEKIYDKISIAYSKYTFANEPTSARGGSFIGAGILLVDKIAEENIIVKTLDDFHANLVANNVKDGLITVNHSDNFEVKKLKDFDKINFNLKEIDELDYSQTSKNLLVYCATSTNEIQKYFKKSIDLLNVYDTIFFTQNIEVIANAKAKNSIPVIQNVEDLKEFELELQKLEKLRKLRKNVLLNDLNQEKLKLSEKSESKKLEFVNNIEANKKTHQAKKKKIEETENHLKKIDSDYNELSKKINELIDKLSKGEKPEIIKHELSDLRSKLRTLDANRPTTQLNSISNTPTIRNIQQPLYNYGNQDSYRNYKDNKSDVYKFSTLLLSITLIGILGWFLYTFLNEEKPIENTNYNTEVIEQTDTDTLKLNPLPNSKSTIKIKKDIKIADIVEEIYMNDTIMKFYKYQKEDYSIHLFKQNEGKFDTQSQDTIFKDTILTYPIYKK